MPTASSSRRARLADIALDRGGRGLSVEFAAGGALLGCLVWAAVVAAGDLSPMAGAAGYVVLAGTLSWFASPTSALLVAGLCVLFADGFAVSREGQLTLTPWVAVVAVALGALCAGGALVRDAWRGHQRRVKTSRTDVKAPSSRPASGSSRWSD